MENIKSRLSAIEEQKKELVRELFRSIPALHSFECSDDHGNYFNLVEINGSCPSNNGNGFFFSVMDHELYIEENRFDGDEIKSWLIENELTLDEITFIGDVIYVCRNSPWFWQGDNVRGKYL